MKTNQISPARRRYYTLLRVGKSELCMTDEDYFMLLSRHNAKEKNGRVSASTMVFGDLVAAVEEMKTKGFKVKHKGRAASVVAGPNRGLYKKIIALWFVLFESGIVRDKSEAGMIAWCDRLVVEDRFEWSSRAGLVKCIEGLKAWAKREKVTLLE